METNKLFSDILANTPEDTNKFADRSMDLAIQINSILKAKGWSQKKLAKELNKTEAEISKWLSGTHNFTLRSITKLEVVIGEDIMIIPMFMDEYNGMYSTAVNETKGVKEVKMKISESYDYDNEINDMDSFPVRHNNIHFNNINSFITKRADKVFISISPEGSHANANKLEKAS